MSKNKKPELYIVTDVVVDQMEAKNKQNRIARNNRVIKQLVITSIIGYAIGTVIGKILEVSFLDKTSEEETED